MGAPRRACVPRPRRRRRSGARELPATGARDHVRAGSRDQPGHAGLPHEQALAGGEGRLRRRGDPARHARRPLELDEDDLPGRARLEGARDRLRVARGLPRRVGRGLGLTGGRRPGHVAGLEHRLVDADRLERSEPRLGPAPQGDQRRGRLADGARSGPSPQHEVAGEGRARSVEPHVAAGARHERDRRDRPDAARAPEAARRLPHEVQAAPVHAAPRECGDRHGRARLRHTLPQLHHQPELDQHPLPARDHRARLRGAPPRHRPARRARRRRARGCAVRVLGAHSELGRARAHAARRRPARHRPPRADARRADDRRRHSAPLRPRAALPERARDVPSQPVADRRHRRGDIDLLGLRHRQGPRSADGCP